jgi:hypothetical protein
LFCIIAVGVLDAGPIFSIVGFCRARVSIAAFLADFWIIRVFWEKLDDRLLQQTFDFYFNVMDYFATH